MKESRIVAVDHVHLQAKTGKEDTIQWFYGELADLPSIDVNPRYGTSMGFKSEKIELWLHFQDNIEIDSIARRVTILVESLAAVIEVLELQKRDFELLYGLSISERSLATLDPAGNRVIFKQYWPYTLL